VKKNTSPRRLRRGLEGMEQSVLGRQEVAKMNEEWQEATPVAFHIEKDKPGRVYRARSQGPPLKVREFNEYEMPSDAAKIVVEYLDYFQATAGELGCAGTVQTFPDGIVRLAFFPSDARFLCMALLRALADGGDRVAERLDAQVNQILDELEDDE